MKKPAISVIIPCYNEERFLPACLESLKQQAFRNFEIIVVDNNCTDKTAAIAKSYGARVVKEKKQGMISARERGFSAAEGTIIARTDADTELPPTWLADIRTAFDRHPEAVALCCGLTFPNLPWIASWYLQHVFQPGYCRLSRWVYGHYPLMGNNNALRKSARNRITVHFNDKQVHEDLDLACHLNEVGEIVYCPHILATYSVRRWRRGFFYTLWEYSLRYIKTLLMHNHKYLHYQRRYKRMQTKIRKSVVVATIRERM